MRKITCADKAMPIKTLDVHTLVKKATADGEPANLFETVFILSKRARQIASRMKEELDTKLSYFEGFDTETEDPQFLEEQQRISMEHELLPEPAEKAIEEMFAGEIYHRDPQRDSDE